MRVPWWPAALSRVVVERTSCVRVSGAVLSAVELAAGPGLSSVVLLFLSRLPVRVVLRSLVRRGTDDTEIGVK